MLISDGNVEQKVSEVSGVRQSNRDSLKEGVQRTKRAPMNEETLGFLLESTERFVRSKRGDPAKPE